MKYISSTDNPLIKELKQLRDSRYRKKRGLYVAEGENCAFEALKRNVRPRQVIASEDLRENSLLAEFSAKGTTPVLCTRRCFRKFTDTQSQTGIALVLETPSFTEEALPASGVILCACGIQDPGNMGTLIRTAEALGASAVYAIEPCAGIRNPKTVRSSSGSVLDFPVFSGSASGALRAFSAISATLVAGIPSGGVSPEDAEYGDPTVVVIGNEARGVRSEIMADRKSVV